VSSQNERAAAPALGLDPLPQELARAHVNAGRRLVQEAHLRLAGQRDCRHQLAPRAAAQVVDRLVRVVLQPELTQHARAVGLEVRLSDALEPGVEDEMLLQSDAAWVQPAELRAVAEQLKDLQDLGAHR
jgi:post-segregation antitoxin (ccd killing protein)